MPELMSIFFNWLSENVIECCLYEVFRCAVQLLCYAAQMPASFQRQVRSAATLLSRFSVNWFARRARAVPIDRLIMHAAGSAMRTLRTVAASARLSLALR